MAENSEYVSFELQKAAATSFASDEAEKSLLGCFVTNFKDCVGQFNELVEDDFYYEQLDAQPGDLFGSDDAVFVSDTVELAVEQDEQGNLVAKVTFDKDAEIKECGIFFTEQISGAHARDWTRVLGNLADVRDNVGTIPLSVYEKSERALVYAFANYSNNFSVTSKIQEVIIAKPFRNASLKSRIIYSAERDSLNGVSGFRRRARSIAS